LAETQRMVFKENVHMADALRNHLLEEEQLQKVNSTLQQSNRILIEERGLHDSVVRQKIVQTKAQDLQVAVYHFNHSCCRGRLSNWIKKFRFWNMH
jgi:hypothetical protein